MKYKAVIFDLDGTLVNSIADLSDSVNIMLKEYGYPEHDEDEYRYFVGNGSRKLVERALPKEKSGDNAFVSEALAKFKKIYSSRYLEKTRAYHAIPEVLRELRDWGIPLGICTNKHQEAADVISRILFDENTFQEVRGDTPGTKRKPDPEKPLEIAQHFGVEPFEVAYLGDSGVDMQTACNAGFLPVGVLWGFRDKKELIENGAEVLLNNPVDLLRKVEFKREKKYSTAN